VGGCSLQGGVGLIPGVMLGVLFLRVVIDAVAKIVRAGSDDYQGMIVGFLVVLAVAFNELRRRDAGPRKEFFPGMLGLCTIPTLAILIGTVNFVLTQQTSGFGPGVVTVVTVIVVLTSLKISEVARGSKTKT
jgi:hypothetical protein